MKKYRNYFALGLFCLAAMLIPACKEDYLAPTPYGQYAPDQLANKTGIDGLLIGAYGMLDGFGYNGFNELTTPTNWIFSTVPSDDAYKGADASNAPDMTDLETFRPLSTSFYYDDKWKSVYEGVARCNDVLRFLPRATDVTETDRVNITAQARFLRGHYHFEGKKVFNRIPYIDENTAENPGNERDIWPDIEADFRYAYENLPETQAEIGRVNKWAAGAYLAKTYLYQRKFTEAKALFDVLLASGKTSKGVKYDLQDQYWKNFDADNENSAESIFAVQHAVDKANSFDGNRGEGLTFPYFGIYGCCGFLQPSQNLVNAHKTDANGLPLPDTFNQSDVKNDQGIRSADPFTPYAGTLDPRLDWSVGRRGIPYYDFGPMQGRSWIRDQDYGGPYLPKKYMYPLRDRNVNTGQNNNLTAKNIDLIRFADLLLMAAEAEVEAGSREKAREYVNRIRRRAANPAGFVKNLDGTPAANYLVNEYTSPWTDQAAARQAVYFERRLELAMEGHRFFDLVRWGIADQVLNAYLAVEQTKRSFLNGAVFKKGINEYFPIPDRVITLTKGKITQNPGY